MFGSQYDSVECSHRFCMGSIATWRDRNSKRIDKGENTVGVGPENNSSPTHLKFAKCPSVKLKNKIRGLRCGISNIQWGTSF